MKSTTIDLASELEMVTPRTKSLERCILKARAGVYHDFESDLPGPKIQAVKDLEAAGLYSFSRRIKDGEFDEQPDEQQKKELMDSLTAPAPPPQSQPHMILPRIRGSAFEEGAHWSWEMIVTFGPSDSEPIVLQSRQPFLNKTAALNDLRASVPKMMTLICEAAGVPYDGQVMDLRGGTVQPAEEFAKPEQPKGGEA